MTANDGNLNPSRRKRRKRREWLEQPAYLLPGLPIVPAMFSIFDIKIEGKLPQYGAAVVASNHVTLIDPTVVGSAIWRQGRAPKILVKASLWKVPVIGWLLERTGQIPVERETGGAVAREAAAEALERGSLVLIYPEGTLTRDKNLWPMRGKTGAVRLAAKANIPLYPVAHWGTHEWLEPNSKRPKWRIGRVPVTVKFGDPIDISDVVADPDNNELVRQKTDELMREIARLVGEIRDEQPPATLHDPRGDAPKPNQGS